MILLKYKLIMVVVLFSFVAKAQSFNKDLDTIQQRFRLFAINDPTRVVVPEPPQQLITSMQKDGSWKDLDYHNKSKVDLPSIAHLSRIIKLAIAYKDSGGKWYKDSSMRNAIHAGLQYWLQVKPQSQNWWHNVIGTPMELAKVLLIMDDELTEKERQQGVQWLRISNRKDTLFTVKSEATGQNMIWISTLQMLAAVLTHSPDYMRFAIRNMVKEIKVSMAEGIQPDWSFHQHGPQLYSGGYGMAFASDCSRIAFVLRQSGFAFHDSVVDALSNYILQGQQWMIWGNKIDYGSTGREIARPNKSALQIAIASDYMAALKTGRQKEFEALARYIRKNENIDNELSGNRHFWNSDFMVHRRKTYYASVKMASVRTLSSESGNGEAEQNFHMGNGNMFILRTGKEYENIFPLWDWQKIPGVTNRIRKGESLPLITFGSGARGRTSFVGGISDSIYGAAAFDMSRDSISGKKAWFFFDKEIVCLGADITSKINAPLVTTLNQCFANGKIIYQANDKQTTFNDTSVSSQLHWLHHDSILYVFDGKSEVHVQQEERKASWSVINKFLPSPPIQAGKVFSVCVEHGQKNAVNAYAYTIVPGIDVRESKAYVAKPRFEILSNTAVQQAVLHSEAGVLQIVFWKAGNLVAKGFGAITVDRPCLLMIRRSGTEYIIAASNPENQAMQLNVRISSRKSKGNIVLDLPGGEQAGKTVTKKTGVSN